MWMLSNLIVMIGHFDIVIYMAKGATGVAS